MVDRIRSNARGDELFFRFQEWQRSNPLAKMDEFYRIEGLSPADIEGLVQRVAAAAQAEDAANASRAKSAALETAMTKTVAAESLAQTRRIGRYALLQEIGSGGMGTVWLAEQSEPVRRRVALKLIKSNLVSHEEVARFEAERQALAMMDHPGIAKIFDGGTTEFGQPYFVMEFVAGLPIHQFCDQHRLSISDRLQLFILVCRAVQHAHQKGIVHRDLKPSNILVLETEGAPIPKVIDFGLAKAIDPTRRLTEKSLFTEAGKVVGTLQYMSPEQASLNSLDIDTRSDIYSLGIVLYELLTGTPPLDRETIHQNAILKILDMIREQEPPRPSQRLGSSAARTADISQQRQINPRQLQSILRGELDWVVMKALEKDRKRRYETAASFADDIHRFLIDEPVIARPASHSYRFSKLVRRNRLAVAIGLLLAISLVSGFIGSLVAWRQTIRAAEMAREKQRQAVEFADQLADNQERANSAISLLHDSLQANLEGFHLEAGQLVDSAQVANQDTNQMDVLIRSRRLLANLYAMLGFHFRQRRAEPEEWGKWFHMASEEFFALDREGVLSPGGIVTYTTTLDNLAYSKSLQNNKPEAAKIGAEIPPLWQRLYEHASPEQRQDLVQREAQFCLNLSNYDDLPSSLTRGIDLLLSLPERHRTQDLLLADLLHNRAMAFHKLGRMEDSQLDGMRAIELREKHQDLESMLALLNVMAILLAEQGKLDQRQIYLDKANRVLADLQQMNPGRLASSSEIDLLFNDAFVHHQQADLKQAEAGYTSVAAILGNAIKTSPELRSRRIYFQTFWHRAEIMITLQQFDDAIPDLREALSAVIACRSAEFDNYIPYLLISLAELEARKDPADVARQLDWIEGEYEAKPAVLAKLAGIYAAAANAEQPLDTQNKWLDRSFYFLQALHDQGLIDEEIRAALIESTEFASLQHDPRWRLIVE